MLLSIARQGEVLVDVLFKRGGKFFSRLVILGLGGGSHGKVERHQRKSSVMPILTRTTRSSAERRARGVIHYPGGQSKTTVGPEIERRSAEQGVG